MIKVNPLISIVIPVYNRISLITKSIESALGQTYKNTEIIVIDNKSTDGTFEFLVEKYGKNNKIILHQNNENIGPVRNWITGIKLSNGKYIKLLFSDDWIDNDFIEKASVFFSDSIGLIYSPVMIHKRNGEISNLYKTSKSSNIFSSKKFIFYTLISYKTPVSPGCAIFKKEDLLKALSTVIDNKNHKEYLKYGAGLDLYCFLSIAENCNNVAFLRDTYSHFFQSRDSFTCENSLYKYYMHTKLYFLKKNKYPISNTIIKIIIILKIDRFISFISNYPHNRI